MTNAFLNVLTLLATISAPPRAWAVSLYDRVACRLALATTFVPGEWIMVRIESEMRPARVWSDDGERRMADVAHRLPAVDTKGFPARRPTRKEREWIRRNLEIPIDLAYRRLNRVVYGGGAGRLNRDDAREVIVARAPRAHVLTRSTHTEMMFNDPDLVDGVIDYLSRLGGRLLLGLPHDYPADEGAAVHAVMIDSYYKRRGTIDRVPFRVYFDERSTRAMLAHELVHVEDLVVDPIPEFDSFEGVDLSDDESYGLTAEVIKGTLEERAHRMGDRKYHRAIGAPSSVMIRYAAYHANTQAAANAARAKLNSPGL